MNFKPKTAKDRLILALDVPTIREARDIVTYTKDYVGVYKIGLQLQFSGGLDFAKELIAEGHKVFLDVKLHDIDNTIEKAVTNLEKIGEMGVKFATIHAYPKTMKAATRALRTFDICKSNKFASPNFNFSSLCLLGVTVLTSMNNKDLQSAGYNTTVKKLVKKRCIEANNSGMDGVVCSPKEVKSLRKLISNPNFIFVTPGIRPTNTDSGDQLRIATPSDAIKAGSDYLVIGRPILSSSNMQDAASKILEEINLVL